MALTTALITAALLVGVPPKPDVRSGASVRRVNWKQRAMHNFFRCVRTGRCNVNQTFAGSRALKDWAGMKRKLLQRKVTIKSLRLVSHLPARYTSRWKRRWGGTARKLTSRGFSKDLLRLGLGKSIVTAKSRVAVALMHVKLQWRGRAKEDYLIVVLWQKGRQWRVAMWEDSHFAIRRFLLGSNPK